MKNRLSEIGKTIIAARARCLVACEAVGDNKVRAINARTKAETANTLHNKILEIGKHSQNKVAKRLEAIVNKALSIVFDGEYSIEIIFEEKRGRTETAVNLKQDGNIIDDIMEDSGGVLDILSFSMRLAMWSFEKTAPIFIIDEPFRNLSIDLQHKAAQMLRVLSDQLKIQIIMASHNPEIIAQADRVFNVDNGLVAIEGE